MIIAGPCSVEGENFIKIAKSVAESGATHLRGGIFKPRSSPDRWWGLHKEAIEIVKIAKKVSGLPFVCEAMSVEQIEILYNIVDIFQIGTRNATATELLKEFGKINKPVIYKRGMAQYIEEFVMGADFILSGNKRVILCERGIRTFENYTRNTFDVSCIPAVKELTDLPIIADPSHGTGKQSLVIPCAKAAIAAGADGLLIEVHDDPPNAITDGQQSLTLDMFDKLMKEL